MSNTSKGFAYDAHASGEVQITHHGRPAGNLRGEKAVRFLAEVENGDPQELMARITDNHKRGNERTAKQHPRNRRR